MNNHVKISVLVIALQDIFIRLCVIDKIHVYLRHEEKRWN